MNTVTDVAVHIKQIWSSSAFMNLLKIEIDEIHCGGATVKMPIDFDIHTNHWLGVHGGALAALADAVMGITGASVGEVVQTICQVRGRRSLKARSNTMGRQLWSLWLK